MKLAIMQPYFFPYIGYFQLINSVDLFIALDNIKYTKKGWINRNRLLRNGADAVFSLPLKSGSDSLDVRERELAADFDRKKLLRQIEGAYQRAPQFAQTFPLLEQVVSFEDTNLFNFLHNSLITTCAHLEIATRIEVSSKVAIDHQMKSHDKVLALCAAVGAETYINAIGGTELYSKDEFRARGIDLKFVKSKPLEYPQLGGEFVPWLSIIDVMMFNPVAQIKAWIATHYELV